AGAVARGARGGGGILNHCHNTQDPNALMDEARAVARAAADVGVKVAFAIPILGRNLVSYGDTAPLIAALPAHLRDGFAARAAWRPDYAGQLELAEEIFTLASPHFLPQYGPVGPQWVDDEVLAEIARRSADRNRRVHMHLLETQTQREWADAAYPGGLIAHLDDLGLLSPRLTVAHGVHLTPADCERLAERGVMVSVNTSSNLRLASGIAPVAAFEAAGLGWGMGLDGMAFDDDEDAFREARLLWHLQRGFGVTRTLSPDRFWQAVLTDSRRAILGPDAGGRVAEGAPADVIALDPTRMTEDVIEGRADITDLMLVRATKADLAGMWIDGRQVVDRGHLTGIDLPAAEAELMAQARHAADRLDLGDVAAIEAAYRRYYASGCHCAAPSAAKGAA
ncbi:MAG: amidohydrolase family protein, partial [Rubellimicrobium sp.]|nr:amidohydrolase family protein [Rubellimicrobium sp.]